MKSMGMQRKQVRTDLFRFIDCYERGIHVGLTLHGIKLDEIKNSKDKRLMFIKNDFVRDWIKPIKDFCGKFNVYSEIGAIECNVIAIHLEGHEFYIEISSEYAWAKIRVADNRSGLVDRMFLDYADFVTREHVKAIELMESVK